MQDVARHPHLAAAVTEGFVRVDMHLHSMWSGDCTTTVDELAEAVAQTGIDVLCLTDHNTVNGALELTDSGALGCRVVVGEARRPAAGEIVALLLTARRLSGL